MSEIENAQIETTMLGTEDHGCMTAWLYLKVSGGGQGFGGYVLDGKGDTITHERNPSVAFGGFVAEVLRVVGVENWEDLPRKHVRIKRDEPFGQIIGIGNILDDVWFYPKEYFAKLTKGDEI